MNLSLLRAIFLLNIQLILTCPVSEYNVNEPVNLIALGDWGGVNKKPFRTRKQLEVAKQMHSYASAVNVSFVLSVGDNFYPNGVESVNDERFKQTFQDVYVRESLKGTPWFIIAGNHDHRQRQCNLQIDYSKLSNVWKFPDYIYMVKLNLKQKKLPPKTIKLIMIDTTILCNLYEFDNFYPNTLNQTYYDLLEDALKTKTLKNDIKILVGHHPIYTAMEERKNSMCISQYLIKLMKTYSIYTYICGHDHTLQYNTLRLNNNKYINMFISGAGKEMYNTTRSYFNLNDGFSTEFFWSRQYDDSAGFMTLSIYSNKLISSFINSKGFNLFNKEIYF